MLTTRRRGKEILDDRSVPDDVRVRAMADVERSNALFGGTRAVLAALRDLLPHLPRAATLLDVGTGTADIPKAARELAARNNVALTTIGLDESAALLQGSRGRLQSSVAGDALHLPFADASVDVVTCSQLLHHFFDDDPAALIAELHRVTRGWVIVSDLERSLIALASYGFASRMLRFHQITVLDGQTSILRGFKASELGHLVNSIAGAGAGARVRRQLFWRVTATWRKVG